MLKSIRKYINDNDMEVIIYKNKIDVINYSSIGHFDNYKVEVSGQYNILIEGNNLVISKLFNDEVLITGIINNIKLGDK